MIVRSPLAQASLLVLLTVAVMCTVPLVAGMADIPAESLTRDPAATAQLHPFVGVISYLGVLMWCAAASVCLFCALVLTAVSGATSAKFMLASGVLTGVLLIDDLFMFHEQILPYYVGIPEGVVYALYLTMALGYVVFCWRELWAHDVGIFIAAGLMLSAMFLVDVLVPQVGATVFLIEDGLKLTGIGLWLLFYVRRAFQDMQSLPHGRA